MSSLIRSNKKTMKKIKKFLTNKDYTIKLVPDARDLASSIYEITCSRKDGQKMSISIYQNMNINDFIRSYEKFYNRDINDECNICCNTMISSAHCSKCSFIYCTNCYIDIFRSNRGIIKCPQCSYKIGQIFPDNEIEIMVQRIKMTISG